MSSDDSKRKLDDLQKYIPFLENMIYRLKHSDEKPRDAQVKKMEALYEMLTDRKKKLKLDTLNKCEEVILKLYTKVEKKPFVGFAKRKDLESTPRSPSPPSRELERIGLSKAPVVIPTEKIAAAVKPSVIPNEFASKKWDGPDKQSQRSDVKSRLGPRPPPVVQTDNDGSYWESAVKIDENIAWNVRSDGVPPPQSESQFYWQKAVYNPKAAMAAAASTQSRRPDIYSSAGESILQNSDRSRSGKSSIFDRLGTQLPPILSKPAISAKDLETLWTSIDGCGGDDDKKEEPTLEEKTNPQLDLRKKLSKKTSGVGDTKAHADVGTPKTTKTPKVVERVIKESENLFGNLLCSIDEQILDKTVKVKKDVRGKKECTAAAGGEKARSACDSKDKKDAAASKKPKDDRTKDCSTTKEHKKNHQHKDGGGVSTSSNNSISSSSKKKHDDVGGTKKDGSSSRRHSSSSDRKTSRRRRSADKKDETKRESSEKRAAPKADEQKDAAASATVVSSKPKTDLLLDKTDDQVRTAALPLPLPKVDCDGGAAPPKRLAEKYNPHPRKQSIESPLSPEASVPAEKPPVALKIDPRVGKPPLVVTAKQAKHSPPTVADVATFAPAAAPTTTAAYGNNNPAPYMHMNAVPQASSNMYANASFMMSPIDNFSAGGRTPGGDPYLGNRTPGDPYLGGGGNTPGDAFLSGTNPSYGGDVFRGGGGMTPGDPFLAKPDGSSGGGYQFQPRVGGVHPPQPQPNMTKTQPLFGGGGACQTAPVYRGFNPYEQQQQLMNNNKQHEYDLSKLQPLDFYPGVPQQRFDGPGNRGIPGNRPFGGRGRGGNYNHNFGGRNWRPPRGGGVDEQWSYKAYREEKERKDRERLDKERREREWEERLNKEAAAAAEEKKKDVTAVAADGDIDKDIKTETVASPLDSLYANDGTKPTKGKGYGMQKFKIPKRHKKEPVEPATKSPKEEVVFDDKKDVKLQAFADVQVKPPPDDDDKTNNVQDVVAAAAAVSTADPEAGLITNLINSMTDKSVLINFLTKFVGEIMSKEDKKKFKRIKQTIESDSESEDDTGAAAASAAAASEVVVEDDPQPDDPQQDDAKAPDVDDVVLEALPPVEEEKTTADVVEDQTVESVTSTAPENSTEPIKKRRKKRGRKKSPATTVAVVKPTAVAKKKTTQNKKRRSDLDMLHADIRDMFISNGVLTATGQRMCRQIKDKGLIKEDDDDDEPCVEDATTAERCTRSKRNAFDKMMVQPKVMLEKMKPDDIESALAARKCESPKAGKNKTAPLPMRESIGRKAKKPAVVDRDEEDDVEEPPGGDGASSAAADGAEHNDDSVIDLLSTSASSLELSPTSKGNVLLSPSLLLHKKKKRRMNNWSKGYIKKKVVRKSTSSDGRCDDDSMSVTSSTASTYDSFMDDAPVSESSFVDLQPPQLEDPTKAPAATTTTDDDDYHDVDYFFQPLAKFRCKLCPYKGKLIIQHYRSSHPDSEILMSRLSPAASAAAKAESVLEEYKDVLAVDTFSSKTKRAKFTYNCRFCLVDFNDELSETFYDHVTTHTGEFRFLCNFCSFKTSSVKSLKGHLHQCHNKEPTMALQTFEPIVDSPPNFTVVFGYMCGRCNFIQLRETNMQRHMQMNRRCAGSEIVKISMSNVATTTTVLTKEPDLNVFVCPADNVESEKKIEDERVKRMAEINANLRQPRKNSFSIVEQLKNKLDNQMSMNVEDEEEEETMLDVAEMGETAKAVKEQLERKSLEAAKAASVFKTPALPPPPPPPPSPAVDALDSNLPVVPTKQNAPVLNTIQKLKKHMASGGGGTKTVEELPEVVASDVTVLKIGPISVEKTALAVQKYICNISVCIFGTDRADVFLTHCKRTHKLYVWSGVCNYCSKVINEQPDGVTMYQTFEHLVLYHLPASVHVELEAKLRDDDALLVNIKKEVKDSPKEDTKMPLLSIRKLPGDNLSSLKDEATLGDVETPQTAAVTFDAADENNFPFKISDVFTMASEQSEPEAPPIEVKAEVQSSPVMYKMTRRMRSPGTISGTSVRKIYLKNIPREDDELNLPKKSPEAMQQLLLYENLMNLYKCPQFFCSYTTATAWAFTEHMETAHQNIWVSMTDGLLVACMYCKYQTGKQHIMRHIELYHGRCPYQCGHCLYRGICKRFVQLHNQMEHIEQVEKIINVKVNANILRSNVHLLPTHISSVVLPYKCITERSEGVNAPCKSFVYTEDFLEHLDMCHRGPYSCNHCRMKSFDSVPELMYHLRSQHNVNMYQCRHCLYGTSTLKESALHATSDHPGLDMAIVVRKYKPKKVAAHQSMTYLLPMHVQLNNLYIVNQHNYDTAMEELEKEELEMEKGLRLELKVRSSMRQYKACKHVLPNGFETVLDMDMNDTSMDGRNQDDVTEDPLSLESSDNIGEDGSSAYVPIVIEDEYDDKEVDVVDVDTTTPAENPVIKTSAVVSTENPVNQVGANVKNLSGNDLFRCIKCYVSFPTSVLFKEHLFVCITDVKGPKPFRCVHCTAAVRSAVSLVDHMRKHGVENFFCSLCEDKFSHPSTLRNHMRDHHKVNNISMQRMSMGPTNVDTDSYVARPQSKHWKQKRTSTDSTSSGKEATDDAGKMCFGPQDLDSLPRQAIFSQEVKCSQCVYKTKVRTNFVRHLELHRKEIDVVPATAPINPVPCLEKNEKMFDKMINLAFASNVTGVAGVRMGPKTPTKAPQPLVQETFLLTEEEIDAAPAYVETTRRFVCGAENCNYLTHNDSMLRSHLQTFHMDENVYRCVHCEAQLANEKLCVNVDVVLKHLKLHDLQLYKCAHCAFLHHQRGKVDHHIMVKHADKTPYVHVLREMEEDKNDKPGGRPWRCGICKARTSSRNDIINHCTTAHSIKSQFKCALCTYKSSARGNFVGHFDGKHPGMNQEQNTISVYFRDDHAVTPVKAVPELVADDEPFDTTPLWQRNKPRVRHIRGILVDVSGPKLTTKTTAATGPVKSSQSSSTDADASMLSVAKAKPTLLPSPPPPPPASPAQSTSTPEVVSKTNLDRAINAVALNIPLSEDEDDQALSRLLSPKKQPLSVKKQRVSKKNPNSVLKEKKCVRKKQTSPGISSGELEEIKNDVLLADKSMGEYGPYGVPHNSQYMCPLCGNFKTQQVDSITHHLYKELEYKRFKCTLCNGTSITYEAMYKHCKQEHKMWKPSKIDQLETNVGIEHWVQKVLMVQKRFMNKEEDMSADAAELLLVDVDDSDVGYVSDAFIELPGDIVGDDAAITLTPAASSTPVLVFDDEWADADDRLVIDETLCVQELYEGNEITTSTKEEEVVAKATALLESAPIKCQYCDYTARYASDVRKHEKRHYIQKPLKCGHCDFEGVTNSEISTHSKRKHPDKVVECVTVPMPSAPSIRPIKHRARKRKACDTLDRSNDVTTTTPLECDADVEASDVEKSNEDVVYRCYYCPKRGANIEQLKTHFVAMHDKADGKRKFAYKSYPKSMAPRSGPKAITENLQCVHCDIVGSMATLAQHNETEHPGKKLQVYRFKCSECGASFKMKKAFQMHFSSKHANKLMPTVTDTIVCEYCKVTCTGGTSGLMEHHAQLHSHLDFHMPTQTEASAGLPPAANDLTGNGRKTYKCPMCEHTSHSYNSIRVHLRLHTKPFKCAYCSLMFNYPSSVTNHQMKEHPTKDFKYETLQDKVKEFDELSYKLLVFDPNAMNYVPCKRRAYKRKNTTSSESNSETATPNKVLAVGNETSSEEKEQPDDDNEEEEEEELTAVYKLPVRKTKPTARKSTAARSKLPKPIVVDSQQPSSSDESNHPSASDDVEFPFMGATVRLSADQMTSVQRLSPVMAIIDSRNAEATDI